MVNFCSKGFFSLSRFTKKKSSCESNTKDMHRMGQNDNIITRQPDGKIYPGCGTRLCDKFVRSLLFFYINPWKNHLIGLKDRWLDVNFLVDMRERCFESCGVLHADWWKTSPRLLSNKFDVVRLTDVSMNAAKSYPGLLFWNYSKNETFGSHLEKMT